MGCGASRFKDNDKQKSNKISPTNQETSFEELPNPLMGLVEDNGINPVVINPLAQPAEERLVLKTVTLNADFDRNHIPWKELNLDAEGRENEQKIRSALKDSNTASSERAKRPRPKVEFQLTVKKVAWKEHPPRRPANASPQSSSPNSTTVTPNISRKNSFIQPSPTLDPQPAPSATISLSSTPPIPYNPPPPPIPHFNPNIFCNPNSEEDMDAAAIVQAVVRGHLARRTFRETNIFCRANSSHSSSDSERIAPMRLPRRQSALSIASTTTTTTTASTYDIPARPPAEFIGGLLPNAVSAEHSSASHIPSPKYFVPSLGQSNTTPKQSPFVRSAVPVVDPWDPLAPSGILIPLTVDATMPSNFLRNVPKSTWGDTTSPPVAVPNGEGIAHDSANSRPGSPARLSKRRSSANIGRSEVAKGSSPAKSGDGEAATGIPAITISESLSADPPSGEGSRRMRSSKSMSTLLPVLGSSDWASGTTPTWHQHATAEFSEKPLVDAQRAERRLRPTNGSTSRQASVSRKEM